MKSIQAKIVLLAAAAALVVALARAYKEHG